jgi:hypothetical protein
MRNWSIRGLLVTITVFSAVAVACTSASEPSGQTGITVTGITPTSGPVGALVTISGSGFAAKNNTVKFGTGYIRGLDSDGTTLRFTVPEGLELCGPDSTGPCQGAFPQVKPGEYDVAVVTRDGSSGRTKFTVTP